MGRRPAISHVFWSGAAMMKYLCRSYIFFRLFSSLLYSSLLSLDQFSRSLWSSFSLIRPSVISSSACVRLVDERSRGNAVETTTGSWWCPAIRCGWVCNVGSAANGISFYFSLVLSFRFFFRSFFSPFILVGPFLLIFIRLNRVKLSFYMNSFFLVFLSTVSFPARYIKTST